jgi:hypothetical protein
VFRMSKNQKLEVKTTLKEYSANLKKITDPFFVSKYTQKLNELASQLNADAAKCNNKMDKLPQEVEQNLKALEALLNEMTAQVRPDFFRIGFYAINHSNEKLYERDVAELNETALSYLDENFKFVQTFLKENLPEAVMPISEATYLAWVDLSKVIPDVQDMADFFANEAGVLLEGGNGMFVGNAEGYVRLNLAMPRSVLQEGLKRMSDAVCRHRQSI